MRVSPAVAAVPLLLLVLTWLSFRAIELDVEQFDHALGALGHFETVESALQRNVLSARIGILCNYDPAGAGDRCVGRIYPSPARNRGN
jgi:hypothetical protein